MTNPLKPLPPHWKMDGRLKRCSVCGFPLPNGLSGPETDAAFREHLKSHKPGQTSEDANQAAFRVVREATEGK